MRQPSLRRLASALLITTTVSLFSHAGLASAVSVSRITAQNAASLIPTGPDASAGIGDWHITNGTLCAVISDVDHEGQFSTKGGVLIDLGFCGRADDHYTTQQDLVNASRRRPLDALSITTEQTQSSASVIVASATPGAAQTTRYTLSTTTPTQLKISKRVQRQQQSEEDFGLYTSLHFNYRSLEPFVFASNNLANSNGFKQEDFVSRGNSAMTKAARAADTIITVSPPSAEHAIAYGWHLESATRVEGTQHTDLPKFILADHQSNAMLVLADTYFYGDIDQLGWLQMVQIPLLELDQGTELAIEQIIYVAAHGDVASITDQILPSDPELTLQRVTGRVAKPDSALHIHFADGTPLTHVRPQPDGSFSFLAPPGNYRATLLSSARRTAATEFAVSDASVPLGLLSLPGAATVSLPKGEAMRLVFKGLGNTQDPNFNDTFTTSSVMQDDGEHFLEPSAQIFLAGLPGDTESVELAAGRYQVYATRGPEYSLSSTQIEVAAGQSINLDIEIPQQRVPTPGYIASDLHVHAGQSFDNTFSDTERVRTFVAEHGEVMVSSEHDKPVDFAPIIRAMGADQAITSIAAAEVTSLLSTELNPYTAGHTNFFPYHPQPLEYRRGMVPNEDRRLRDIIYDVRQLAPDVLVQLNHPRQSDRLSGDQLPRDFADGIDAGDYFEHMGPAAHPYVANKPLQQAPNNVLIEADPETGLRDLDFDLLEVVNAGGPDHESRIRAVRDDWLSLLKQGELKVATANSDSHNSTQQVAVPRNMVAVNNDSVSTFDEVEFLAALKAGNSYGTTGPMLELSLSGKQMGQTFSGQRGQLSLRVRTADWIPVDTAKVQINGQTIAEYPLPNKGENTLLIPLSFNQDSFVTVEVTGPVSDVYRAIYADISPYAFSNPIYVDFDADGKWQAPGL